MSRREIMRINGRSYDSLRPIQILRHYTQHAEGSVLIGFGNTKVLCNASVNEGVPRFLRDSKQGWLTAEYGMLPRATHTRGDREAARGKQSGRTQEIQRLIGRSLRACVDLSGLQGYTIIVDCDVLQADGGTRTAAITGGCVALYDAIQYLLSEGKITLNPFQQFVGAVSAGIVNDQVALDLNYSEDSTAGTDMNVVMNEEQKFIEMQGTAEDQAFSQEQLNTMLEYAQKGIQELIHQQKSSLGLL